MKLNMLKIENNSEFFSHISETKFVSQKRVEDSSFTHRNTLSYTTKNI